MLEDELTIERLKRKLKWQPYKIIFAFVLGAIISAFAIQYYVIYNWGFIIF